MSQDKRGQEASTATDQAAAAPGAAATVSPDNPTLPQLQRYMAAICLERGWTQDNYAETFLLFTEEIGELAKAIRKIHWLYQEHARPNALNLEEEFADVLSYLLDLANCFNVDLERAFRAKERSNATRRWGQAAVGTIGDNRVGPPPIGSGPHLRL